MLLRNRSGEPLPGEVAVYNQSITPYEYRRQIDDSVRYWNSETARAAKTGSGALHSMSATILNEFEVGRRTWRNANRHVRIPENREIAEIARRRVLSALGVSMLLRSEWDGQPAAVPDFVGPQGELGTVLDIVVDQRLNPDRSSESRVHVLAAAPNALPADAAEQWYKEGDLWVCQVRPAEPTDYLVGEFLPRIGIENPDFTQHETLYPYVAAS